MKRKVLVDAIVEMVDINKAGYKLRRNPDFVKGVGCAVDMIAEINEMEEIEDTVYGTNLRSITIPHPFDLLIEPKRVSLDGSDSYANLKTGYHLLEDDVQVTDKAGSKKLMLAIETLDSIVDIIPNLKDHKRWITAYDARGNVALMDMRHVNRWAYDGKVRLDDEFFWEGMPVQLEAMYQLEFKYTHTMEEAIDLWLNSFCAYDPKRDPYWNDDRYHATKGEAVDGKTQTKGTVKSGGGHTGRWKSDKPKD